MFRKSKGVFKISQKISGLGFGIGNRFYFNNANKSDNFLTGESASYLENIYKLWKKDKNSVDASWDDYFSNLEQGKEYSSKGLSMQDREYSNQYNKFSEQFLSPSQQLTQGEDEKMKVLLLIRAYQRNGYLKANLDPLGLDLLDSPKSHFPIYESRSTLDYKSYEFQESDLEKTFNIYSEKLTGVHAERKPLKLKEIIERLNKAYCGTIGADYMFISSREECNFMREKFEVEWANYQPTKEEKVKLFDRLAWAVLFEEFLHNKFTTHTRFGLEGLESMISGLKGITDFSVRNGMKDITFGMAHRGRLNVLANVMRKPLSIIFAEFQGKELELVYNEKDQNPEIEYFQSGDVKYHMGTFHERVYPDGRTISMDLLPNPSHLESVNPVVMGKVRAKQFFNEDSERNKHLCVLIHGDAAFAGQGVIYESMQMENLQNYTVGGTIHVMANNQIGFTTTPKDGRSTPFVSDILKAYESPIIHVNADDPIAVYFAFKVASEYRMKFKKDIIVDIIGYRKYGHNELDQPMFTQPLMYKAIAKKENVLKIYMNKVIENGDMTQDECNRIIEKIRKILQDEFKKAETNAFEKSEWVSKQWQHLDTRKYSEPKDTGVSVDKLREYNQKIHNLPKDYTFHPMIKKIYENRYQSVKTGKNIDMGTAEALCWASLLDEGYMVRISGEDVERGSFSQRHAVLHDQEEDRKYIPLKQVGNPRNFKPCNSHLSEFSVLGFELGVSYYNPDSLVIWEAQFGDFVNGAQIIIDNFIASGERKWNTQSGIVLNLPHGMDGQGPEHSSCKLERFLSMMDDDINDISCIEEKDKVTQIQESNWQVCYPTTSANYFHLFRRQLKRDFRKPLILAFSKKLLKFKMANSSIEEFDESTRFIKVRNESNKDILSNADKVKSILACSGQVYYDLIKRRQDLNRNDVAIIAVEQIGPFPYIEFLNAIKPFPKAKLTWVQEEHVNQGAWEYVRSRINNLFKISKREGEIAYAGRPASSAAATGFRAIFDREKNRFLEDAYKI